LYVRPARRSDLADLVVIFRHLRSGDHGAAGETTVSAAAEAAWSALEEQRGHTVLVADDGHRIVGCLHLVIVPSLANEADPWAMVENVVVLPAWRGRGAGSLLLRAAIDHASDAGCYRIHAVSSPENSVSHRLFRAAGFGVEATAFRRYLKH
jgi:L-amino acid N-acyltransferase YncA